MFRGKQLYKKISLLVSLVLILVWSLLGAGTSLAWFSDTSEEVVNLFHMAEFDLEVSHRLPDGTYEPVDAQTKLFDENALYEPGYVQVVYLKVENKGTVPFDFQTAVSVTDFTPAVNVFGSTFQLQEYLRFGLVTMPTEAEMDQAVATRTQARAIATQPLSQYSPELAELAAKDEVYVALVVQMPEEVGNEANYRGDTAPTVELGVIVSATQKKN